MMNRRDFLSAAAGSTLALAAADAKDTPKMPPVVDTHQHLWDLTKVRLNWVKKDDPLNHSFTPTEYAAASEGLNIVKTIAPLGTLENRRIPGGRSAVCPAW